MKKNRQDPATPYVDTGDWKLVSVTPSPAGLPVLPIDPDKIEDAPGIQAHLIRNAEGK